MASDTDYVWLNDLSRLFLERDYLLEDQTVDERVDIICNAAGRLLGRPDFPGRFKENIRKGWYSMSTPIWSNFGTDRGLPISCVVGNTWINTSGNGGKHARDIQIGDEVLTHKGRYRKVTNVMVTPEQSDIYRLGVSVKMTCLYLTGNHLVLTNSGWVRTDNLDPEVHLVAISIPYNDGSNYSPIEIIEKTDRTEDVYDFTVEEDHSFSAAGVVLHNCFGSSIGDDMESILYTQAEVGMMTKTGGGTSAYFGNLRPRGSAIRNNGHSSGSVHFMQLFDNLIKIISQGSCYAEGTEVLTNRGFKDFRRVANEDLIAQVDASNNVTFTDRYELVEQPYAGKLKCFRGQKRNNVVSIKVTPDHRMAISRHKNKQWGDNEIVPAKDVKLHQYVRMYLSGKAISGAGLSFEDRLRIAYRFAGSGGPDGRMSFRLGDDGQVATLMWMLDGLGIHPKVIGENGVTEVNFDCDLKFKVASLEWVDLAGISLEWAYEFIDSMTYWLGPLAGAYAVYSSRETADVDMVQAIACLCSMKTRVIRRDGLSRVYLADDGFVGGETIDSYEEDYDGTVYCAVVPEGRLIVRHDGKTAVCGNTRRGNFAGYLPTDHADIDEFLTIRSEGSPIQDMSFGVCVPDYWMESMVAGDYQKRKTWARVLESRTNTGYPYIFFSDTANRNTVDVYKDRGLKITHSNLCSEIMLPDSDEESFVCDLSSMNVSKFDEWKDTDAVELLVYFLDAVMTEFIDKASGLRFMDRAVRFARRHRALGIGWIGWHTYLQEKMVPFESMEAQQHNVRVAKTIHDQAYAASAKLAVEYGEPELLVGYGRRNTTLLAMAPTKSSSFIIGQTSENTEADRSNYYIKDLCKGKFTIKNRILERLLVGKDQNTDPVWEGILAHGGSVQHLPFLSRREKDVFKTFAEISPKEIIIQAAQRQKYIDQSQSLNLMIHPSVPIKDVNRLIIDAWEMGIKSLYYQIGVNAAQQFSRNILNCAACEA